jgi:hypothetical protein
MKKVVLVACVVMLAVALSYVPTEGAVSVVRSRSKASCSGVAKSRVYSRGHARASCSGVSRSKVRAKTCSGSF